MWRQAYRALLGIACLAVCVGGSVYAQGQPLANGGFEEGLRGWHPVLGGYGQTDPEGEKSAQRVKVATQAAHEGKGAVVLDAVGLGHEVDLFSDPVSVNAGYGYRLRSYVRQLKGDSSYKVTIDWRTAQGEHLVYDNDWKGGDRPEQFTLHGGIFVAPEEAGEAVIILGVQRGAKCAFDSISLDELGPAESVDARARRDGDGALQVTGPTVVQARSYASWSLTYTVGDSGLVSGAGVTIRRTSVSFDWSEMQTESPNQEGYVSVVGPDGAELKVAGGQTLRITAQWPALQPGEKLTIKLGDRSRGGPGLRVQGRPESGIEWAVASDTDADGEGAAVGAGGAFDVVPGPASRLALVCGATAEAGRAMPISVQALDEAGNVAPGLEGTCRLRTSDGAATLPGTVRFGGDAGAHDIICHFATPGIHTVKVEGPRGIALHAADIVVGEPTPGLAGMELASPGAVASDAGAVIGNARLRAVLPRNPYGLGYIALYAKVGPLWEQLGAMPSLGEVWWPNGEGEPLRTRLYASEVTPAVDGDEASLVLSGTLNTPGGSRWPFTARLRVAGQAQHMDAEFSVTPRSAEPLLAFYGPRLYAGEGGFGAAKRLALFPALEYLTAEEVSSDDKGVAWPIRERWGPHPYKVTVPLMAVASERATVALMWDPVQEWHTGRRVPRPWFASPNRPEHGANHLMALFAPFEPDEFTENLPHAGKPWVPSREGPVRLKASVALLAGADDVVDAIRYYIQTHDLPRALAPRSYEEGLALSAIGHLDTGWDEEAKGWITAIGWEPGFQAGIADQLAHLSMLTKDGELASRMTRQVQQAIETHGVRGPELNFRMGNAAAATAGLRQAAMNAMSGQHREGYWTFEQAYSLEGDKATLARPGDIELGTCVNRLRPILRYAVVSGEPSAIEAGLRGLSYIERFHRPAGSESWEVPLVNPNLRAAALACECYVDAYRLTGEDGYLEKARYWAWSGLSFIYLWEAPDRPIMPGASISVMGTTFYKHPWFGAAVQWVGLAYASTLQYLADHDDSFAWRDIAALITASAMKQQETPQDRGGHAGYYPDSYHVVRGEEYYDWDLAPTGIIANVLELMGKQAGLATSLTDGVTPAIRITSVASVEQSAFDDEVSALSARLRYYPKQTSQVVVFGLSRPQAITWAGRPVARVDDIAQAVEGWQYVEQGGFVVCKLRWDSEDAVLRMTGGRPTPYQTPRRPTSILNGGFEDGMAYWQWGPEATVTAQAPYAGKAALRIDAPDPKREGQATGPAMGVTAGRTYRLSAYVRQLQGQGQYKVTIDWRDEHSRHLSYANDWQGTDRPAEYSAHGGVFTAPAGAAEAVIIVGCRGARCLFDDVTLTVMPLP